jgi:hypothetical protein
LSVDPVLGDTNNPQRLNRYRYASNDPINYLDPDGAEEEAFVIRVKSTARVREWGSGSMELLPRGQQLKPYRRVDPYPEPRNPSLTEMGSEPNIFDCLTVLMNFTDALPTSFWPAMAASHDALAFLMSNVQLAVNGEWSWDQFGGTALNAFVGLFGTGITAVVTATAASSSPPSGPVVAAIGSFFFSGIEFAIYEGIAATDERFDPDQTYTFDFSDPSPMSVLQGLAGISAFLADLGQFDAFANQIRYNCGAVLEENEE